ncbi:unnamed protein product, partial [Effrenium voratum]
MENAANISRAGGGALGKLLLAKDPEELFLNGGRFDRNALLALNEALAANWSSQMRHLLMRDMSLDDGDLQIVGSLVSRMPHIEGLNLGGRNIFGTNTAGNSLSGFYTWAPLLAALQRRPPLRRLVLGGPPRFYLDPVMVNIMYALLNITSIEFLDFNGFYLDSSVHVAWRNALAWPNR